MKLVFVKIYLVIKLFFKNKWSYFITIIIGFVMGILVNIPSCTPEKMVEYIPVHDTITITQERILEHTKVINTRDTVVKVIVLSDTILDSVYVKLPMEHKEYIDTIKTDSVNTIIDIKYHGIYTNIDSVYINHNYYKEREVIIKLPKRFGLDVTIGPYIGYGIGYTNGFIHGPQIGIAVSFGISYRIK